MRRRALLAWARRALLATSLAALTAVPAVAQDLSKARGSGGGCIHRDTPPHSPVTRAKGVGVNRAFYVGPTQDYRHGILGDAIEADSFLVKLDAGVCDQVAAGPDRVFEDTSPRIADLDGDGMAEIIVVASHQNFGARLEVYGYRALGRDIELLAHTPYIGRKNRWLAPIGAADLDGDGFVEIGYIDRPHLVKSLRVFRYKGGKLREVSARQGFTNHRIGERDIAGGIRTCAGTPEMIVATADWSRLQAVTLQGKKLTPRDIGPHKGRKSFAAAMACK